MRGGGETYHLICFYQKHIESYLAILDYVVRCLDANVT